MLVLIFIFRITDILNAKTKEIILNITNAKYNPLLSKNLYKQKIVSNDKEIMIIVIISLIVPPSYSYLLYHKK